MPFFQNPDSSSELISPLKIMGLEGPPIFIKDNPLAKSHLESTQRDRAFAERFALIQREINAAVARNDALINDDEAHLNQDERTARLNAAFENLFTSMISSLQIMVGNLLIAPPPYPQECWEKRLQRQLFEKYEYCVNRRNYENIQDFFKAIYEAVFYSAYRTDMQIDEELAQNLEKIKAAADLEACAGGAIS